MAIPTTGGDVSQLVAHAVAIWPRLACQDCPEAVERLAKYYEHVQRDHYAALRLTRRLQRLDRQNSAHAQRERRLL